jgi:hypothetical protein
MCDKKDQNGIVIRAIPPQDLSEEQRRRLARVTVEMLRKRGFDCTLTLPEGEE